MCLCVDRHGGYFIFICVLRYLGPWTPTPGNSYPRYQMVPWLMVISPSHSHPALHLSLLRAIPTKVGRQGQIWPFYRNEGLNDRQYFPAQPYGSTGYPGYPPFSAWCHEAPPARGVINNVMAVLLLSICGYVHVRSNHSSNVGIWPLIN